MRLNPKPVVKVTFATAEMTMSKDRAYVTGLVALAIISTALELWLIFSEVGSD